ncbi:MFS multidrug transporter-like protein [Calycina marina]|uniref:MFS multidrug transporter-like protein n=1 Tax=Calycina marina TaxID=1763456 RepID=A0A9P8CFQ8_9HELO|nr:MFS multidrug transporter-like protein [Calycina marina]
MLSFLDRSTTNHDRAHEQGQHTHSRSFDTLKSTNSDISYNSIQQEKAAASNGAAPKRGWRFYGTFACLALLNFICAIDATILSVALPTISSSLQGTTAIEAFWCGTGFLLTSTVFQPTWASFSHIFGRKLVLLTALFTFTLGTVICSTANKIALLLVGRCVQGVGGGGLVALTYVIVADMVPLRERGKWFSIISLQWAIGSVMGPVIGGAFAEKTNWRWIFWLNIPFCAVAFIGIPICLRLNQKGGSIWTKLRAFDWYGSIIFIGATTSFLIPLTWGGIMYAWSAWRTLTPLLVGVGGLIGFILYSVYFSTEPLIRRSLFNSSTAIQAYLGTMVHGMIVWSLLFYMPIYFEGAKEFTPTMSGIAIFPFTLTTAPAAVIVGLVITKTGRFRPSLWAGWFLATLGMGLLILLKDSTSTVAWVFISLVSGSGNGILFSAQGFAAQASVSNADLPFAGAMYSFFRSFGQTLGVAIAGVMFQNTFRKKVLRTAYAENADLYSKNAAAMVQIVRAWPDDGALGVEKAVMKGVYVESLQMVWVIMCALGGVAFLTSLCFTKEISLERELETEQGFIGDERKSKSRRVTFDEEQHTPLQKLERDLETEQCSAFGAPSGKRISFVEEELPSHKLLNGRNERR